MSAESLTHVISFDATSQLQSLGKESQTVSREDCSFAPGKEQFERLRSTLAPLREKLLAHPMYAEVNSLQRLQAFMQMHVFAVWDFMSLVKRLQNELTCSRLPWTPPGRAQIARFANEVVLGEESDLGPDGRPVSHFELYLRAMEEVGADTTEVKCLVAALELAERWEDALGRLNTAPAVATFVERTLKCATEGSLLEVASFFCFGREDVIPEMFERLLGLWRNARAEVPHFCYYLERHIELDGGSHGPLACDLLTTLLGTREADWQAATRAATEALTSRIQLWDGVLEHLREAGLRP